MFYKHLDRGGLWQRGRVRGCVRGRSRIGNATGIGGWWDGDGFIGHKLGFDMDLSNGTCCSFDFCNYGRGNFLEGDKRTSAKAVLEFDEGVVALEPISEEQI
jgi:hypothetical protein